MSPVGDDVDLGPWAAYALGHHPYILMDWHRDCWGAFYVSCDIIDRGGLYGAPPELGELDEALRILSSRGRVDPAALNDFRGDREKFVAISKEIEEFTDGPRFTSDLVDFNSDVEPGYGALMGMITECDRLVAGPDDLRPWLRLGAAVGEYHLMIVTRWLQLRWRSTRECFDEMRDLVQKLTLLGEYPFLSQIGHHLSLLDPAVEPPPDESHIFYSKARLQAVINLDGELRHGLRAQAPPEFWLDLDQDRLLFFGVPFYVSHPPEGRQEHPLQARLSLTEAAILWVLAEHAGEVVHRTTIRVEGKVPTTQERLPETISRMRPKLQKAVDAYYARRGWKVSEGAESCFILPVEGRGRLSPYKLAMSKSRVRLAPVRPPWMKPRTGA